MLDGREPSPFQRFSTGMTIASASYVLVAVTDAAVLLSFSVICFAPSYVTPCQAYPSISGSDSSAAVPATSASSSVTVYVP